MEKKMEKVRCIDQDDLTVEGRRVRGTGGD